MKNSNILVSRVYTKYCVVRTNVDSALSVIALLAQRDRFAGDDQ